MTVYTNTGDEGWKIIKEKYQDDGSFTGRIMPNITNVSPQAIVPNTAVITFNYPDDVAPTGGADGDIWYNFASDTLYKRASGIWSLLTDRASNANYNPPVLNLSDCPL